MCGIRPDAPLWRRITAIRQSPFARHLGLLIRDQTSLTGDFDFSLDLTPESDHDNKLDRRDQHADNPEDHPALHSIR
jgi:uncharacterized protein (TIGR03435 family)